MENINPNHPINELWPPYGVINHIAFLATSHSSKHPAMHSAPMYIKKLWILPTPEWWAIERDNFKNVSRWLLYILHYFFHF